MTRNTQIHVNENILLHLVRPRCIFTHMQIFSCIHVHMHTFTYVHKIYIYVKFTYVCKSACVNCTLKDNLLTRIGIGIKKVKNLFKLHKAVELCSKYILLLIFIF